MRPAKFNHRWFKFVENEYGEMLIYEPPAFHPKYEKLTYQKSITRKIIHGNYMTFVDVGAAWGYFPLIASHHCAFVSAYEANPFRYGILLYNTANRGNILCHYKFVGCIHSKEAKLDNPFLMVDKSGKKEIYIPRTTLFQELFPYIGKMLIKIDVEGNEMDVLCGAEDLLDEEKVHWFIDVHPQHGIKKKDVIDRFFRNRKISHHEVESIFVGGFK
jgi:FkbM family methyltransferase